MSYSEFHTIVDGMDAVFFIIIIVGFVWAWLGNKGDTYE